MGKKNPDAGYRFKLRNHSGLTYGLIDAYLEHRGGDRTAWSGRQTTSGAIGINAPQLFGGDKDQGGIVGTLYVMMGEESQVPNAMLVSAFGNQTTAWRGFATVAFDGLYGSNNPYPQAASHKIEKVLKGWDNDACWYPEKAPIPIPGAASAPVVQYGYWRVEAGARYTLQDDVTDYGTQGAAFVGTADEIAEVCVQHRNDTTGTSFVSAGGQLTTLGTSGDPAIVAWTASIGPTVGIAAVRATPVCPSGFSVSYEEGGDASGASGYDNPLVVCTLPPTTPNAINPAHALYYLRTQSHLGGEPTASIDDASFRAAADQLHAEGFGICVRINTDDESPEDIENRICKLIGGSVNRSLEDGKLYLDLARGSYVLEELPIVSDDDILEFSEQPTTPEGAVNSVSVRYFDPQRKETIITPSVDALGLIDAFGLNHQVIDYPEIPTGTLATRIATREFLNYITPSRVFDLVCMPTVYALRPNQYFRLKVPKRGIADMVCLVGDKQDGTLKSGAIRLQAAQDIYTLPDFGTVDVEPGVDPTPSAPPVPISEQIAFEAPYVNVCAAMSRADLAVLPEDVGYLIAAADDPATSRDFTLAVDDGAGFAIHVDGEWCPIATINEAAGPLDTAFTFSAGKRLDEVEAGDFALWGSELCRVDALDRNAATISLGRGCADTVPQSHAAGEKLWFYGLGAAYDTTEYTDGDTISAKLLTNSWSAQLVEGAAAAMPVTFGSRQVRPYPPGRLRFTDDVAANQAWPAQLVGLVVPAWVHRDRVLQADQLLESEATSVGPEVGTTYSVSYQMPPGIEAHAESGITGMAGAGFTFAADGIARVEITAHRDGYESWQVLGHTFNYYVTPPDTRVTAAGDRRVTASADVRIAR